MRKQVATLLTVVFLFSIGLTANAAVKPGASCKKLGQISISSGKKYTCIKSGKKLVWNKGVVIKNTTPTPSPTPTPTPTPSPTPTPTPTPTPIPTPSPTNSQNLKFNPRISCGGSLGICPQENRKSTSSPDSCKVAVPRNQLISGPSIGFPRPDYAKKDKEALEILIAPVSFKDLTFKDPQRELMEIISYAKETYRTTSWGKAKLNFTIIPDSSMIKEESTFKEFQEKNNSSLEAITQLLVQKIDFPTMTQFDSVVLMSPQSNSISWGGGNVGAIYDSKYGKVGSVYLSIGGDRLVDLPHLLGHTLYALSDLYISSQAITENVAIPENLLFYDLMANGYSKDFVGFIRWVNGWMQDSQVICLDPKSEISVVYLTKLDEISGTKLIAIPVESGKVVMAEFRRGSFDDGEGLLVYSFDQNTPPGYGQMRQVRFGSQAETLLVNEQSGTLFGKTFKVLAVDKDGMYVQISNG